MRERDTSDAGDVEQEVVSVAERVAARYRREFHRLLVAGVAIAVVILALGLVVVYGLGEMPGMSPPG